MWKLVPARGYLELALTEKLSHYTPLRLLVGEEVQLLRLRSLYSTILSLTGVSSSC